MTDTCIIFLGGTPKQHKYFFPSYFNCLTNAKHDIIYVHRNGQYLNKEYKNNNGKIIYENSFVDDVEIPHKAFGKYRYYFNKYADKYKNFIFMSDDVVLKRDYWIEYCINYLNKHEKQGAVGTMLSNTPTHIRAPFWVAKSECLKKIKWEFNDDHDGEMRVADQITDAGYFSTQVGERITIGYDVDTALCYTKLETQNFLKNYNIFEKFNTEQINFIKNKYLKMFYDLDYTESLGPYIHNIPYNTLLELTPIEGLIYNKSIDIIKDCGLKFDDFKGKYNRNVGRYKFLLTEKNNLNIIKW